MRERAHRILAVATKHKTEHLILGAWGCGVFNNDPWIIAKMFYKLIANEFAGTFKTIMFAIPDAKIYNCFREAMK